MSDGPEASFTPLLQASIKKAFPRRNLSPDFALDIQLSAPKGITAILGNSGAGKTLLLNCLTGFVQPDSGRVLLNGRILFDSESGLCVTASQRSCAYIFQDHALFPHMTVRDNLRFAGSVGRGRSHRLQLHRRMTELLETFEIADLANRLPAQLSGGEKQRAAIARILVNEPQAVFLDEPTRGLDLSLRRSFYDVLHEIRQRLPIPILLVTHDVEESLAIADFVYVLSDGREMQSGTPETILVKPASASVARLLGFHQLIPAEIESLDPGRNTSCLRIFDQQWNGPYFRGHLIGDTGLLCVRNLDLSLSKAADTADAQCVSLPLRSVVYEADAVRLILQGGLSLTVSNEQWRAVREQPRVHVHIPNEGIAFLPET
jgi:molybdate transport system ATP-binding protein